MKSSLGLISKTMKMSSGNTGGSSLSLISGGGFMHGGDSKMFSMSQLKKSALDSKVSNGAELIQHILSLQMQNKNMKLRCKTLERNLKAVVFKESVDFLKDKSKIVAEILTKNHRKVVTQFIDYRTQTNNKMVHVETMRQNLMQQELEFSTTGPVAEAEYQLKRKVQIALYDCLIPRLKVKKKPTQKKKTENDSDSDYFGDLIVENDRLKA